MYLSRKEKSRRYELVRQMMRENNLSGLLVFSNAQVNQQGFVRFFTDLPIPIYSHALLFPIDSEPFYYTPSPLQTYWAKKESWIPKDRIALSKEPGTEMCKIIKSRGKRNVRWGVVNYELMPARDYMALCSAFPALELIDATQLLENVRGPKSKEELILVRASAEIAQLSQQVLAREMKKGITEEALVAKVEETLRAHGAERTFYLISSSPGGFFPYVPSRNRLDGKTPVLFSCEVSGPGGYWTQMVRTLFWQKPKGVLMEMYKTLSEISEAASTKLRPGRKISEVAREMRSIIHTRGFDFGVHFGHALGLDVVEEPLINTANNRALQAGQIIVIHPHLINRQKSLSIWTGDTYLVQEKKVENLTPYDPNQF